MKQLIISVSFFALFFSCLCVDASNRTSANLDDSTKVYKLVWSDEFDGTAVNLDDWTMEQGYIANNELQDYQKEGNAIVSDGTLKIIAQKVNDDKKYGSYTSARMITAGKQEFTYGRIEAKMKLPVGVGVWPAFWMLGSSINQGVRWPACGEIDIMEYVGYEPHNIHGSLHSADYSGGNSQTGRTLVEDESDWNVYGMTWTVDKIEFYIGEPTNVYCSFSPTITNMNNWPYVKPHFILLNLAIGGDWGGIEGVDNSIFPAVMEVDYVRVYQKEN